VIDTHVHIGTSSTTPPGEPYESAEALLKLMDRQGIESAVLVPYLGCTDNSAIAESLARYRSRFVGLAYIDWRRSDAYQELERLHDRQRFSGIRLETDARSPGPDPFLVWRTAFSLDLWVSAQGGRSPSYWAGPLREVLEAIPGLRVRIEHLGRPQVSLGVDEPAFQAVLRLARFPNVVVNVDGLWAVSKTGAPYHDVWPFAEAVLAAFGSKRVMWGSDFPYVLEYQSYAESCEEMRNRLASFPASVSEDVLQDTPQRAARIPYCVSQEID
jgi:predicted TIM-barrel fold metal-dependent hydrolase